MARRLVPFRQKQHVQYDYIAGTQFYCYETPMEYGRHLLVRRTVWSADGCSPRRRLLILCARRIWLSPSESVKV